MDEDGHVMSPPDSDDSDGQSSVEYGGGRWRQLREDPRHEAFNVTGLNISQVLTVIYEVSHGINYHTSKHLVKCGVNGDTQVRNSFETLRKLGHYDDIAKYVRPDALITESLPTADSGSRYQHTYDPDGSMKAMLVQGWFDKGGVGENWKRAFMPCVNVDTGLTEPLKLNVFKYTASGIPTFKHAYKRKSVFSNRKKCKVCYTTMRQAFEDQEAYVRGGGKEANDADEMEARQRPIGMGFIGVGAFGGSGEGPSTFEIPLWMKFFTYRFTGIEHLYRMVRDIIPDIAERINFWMGIAALDHELTLDNTEDHAQLMFHVYSFRDFVYSVQMGRFHDLVLLARKSEEKNARDYSNATLLTRLRNLLAYGERNDFDGKSITYEDYTKSQTALVERSQYLESVPGWIAVFNVVVMDASAVISSVDALLATDSLKLEFMKNVSKFLDIAEAGFRWFPFAGNTTQTHAVQSLKDFVDAIIAHNFDGVLGALHAWVKASVKSLNREPDVDFILCNMKALLFEWQRFIAHKAGVVIPLWVESFNSPLGIDFVRNFLRNHENTEEGTQKLQEFKENLSEMYVLSQNASSVRYNQMNIVPAIDSSEDFFSAVLNRRFDSLISQLLNSFKFSIHLTMDTVLRNLEVLMVPQWIITFSQHISADSLYLLLSGSHETDDKPHVGHDDMPRFKSHLVQLLQKVKNTDIEWENQKMRKITPGIDTLQQFVAALMGMRFDDLVDQMIFSLKSYRYYNFSMVMHKCELLILKINELHPSVHDPSISPVPEPPPVPDIVHESDRPADSPRGEHIPPSSPVRHAEDNVEVLVEDIEDDTNPFSDTEESEFNENWVSVVNAPHDEQGIEKLFQDCVSGLDIQRRLNFIKNLEEFIKKLRVVENGENAELYNELKGKRTRPRKIDYFASEISLRHYPRLISSIMKCIQGKLSDKDYWESLKYEPTVRFSPRCKLQFIIKNLESLRVKGLELTNRVYHPHKEFTTPQWVLDFTDTSRQDDEAVRMLYDDLLRYLPTYIDFDNHGFLKCLGSMVRYSENLSFRGILIKTPIVTMSHIVSSINSMRYEEFCSTVYYDPDGPNPERYARFFVRFKLFSEYCQAHLKEFFTELDKKRSEEFDMRMREREAEKKKLPKDLYQAHSWMQKLCDTEGLFEILHLIDEKYNSLQGKFMIWKLLHYFMYRIDRAYSAGNESKSSPINTIPVFLQAVSDKRFDDLLFYVHTTLKSESSKELMTHMLDSMLNEMKENARNENVQYGHGFKEWKQERDRVKPIIPPNAQSEQEDSEASLPAMHDPDAEELSDWVEHTPRDFEILIEDDSVTVGDFQWVFDLIGYTTLDTAKYTMGLKDLSLATKKMFVEKLPKFIQCLEKFKPRKDETGSEKYKRIYKWREFIVAVTENENFIPLAKIMYRCDGKRLDYRRFYVSIGISKLMEMYNHLTIIMERTTPVKTSYENQVTIFQGQGFQLSTHNFRSAVVMIGNTIEHFVEKPPAKNSRDSLFECIKDSMVNLLKSGVKAYFLYIPSFFKGFQFDPEWCDNQRNKIRDELLLNKKTLDIYQPENKIKKTYAVEYLVMKKYFPDDVYKLTKARSIDSISKFIDPNKLSEMVDNEFMQLISDKFNLTIAVTYPSLVKKIRRRREFHHGALGSYSSFQDSNSLPRVGMAALNAPVWRENEDSSDDSEVPAVPLPEPHEYMFPSQNPSSEDDMDVEEIADTVVFTPAKEQLDWENYETFSQRRSAHNVKIFLKYSRAEEMADGTKYTGYQTLISAEMTEVFTFYKIDNVMQRNVVDMLVKLQKQCVSGDHRWLKYNSKAYNITPSSRVTDPFVPEYEFFKFTIPEEFLIGLVSQDSRSAAASDDNLLEGWNIFVNYLKQKTGISNPSHGSPRWVLVNKIEPDLKCFEFANLIFSAGPSRGVSRRYWLLGIYDFTAVRRNWRTALYNNQDWNSDSGYVFDSVQLTRPDNSLLPPFAVDLVFESVHLTSTPAKENEAHYYLNCIWISLLSYIFHQSVLKVSEVKLTKEQYYFVTAVIAHQTSIEEFQKFVLELLKRNKTEIEQELSSLGEGSETMKKKKLEYHRACTEVISQLGESKTDIEFNASHKNEIATVLNLMIIESEMTHDMKLSPDRSHFVVRSRNNFVGRDSFYINPSVFPTPDLLKDPVRFMIRKDFAPVALSQDVFNVQIKELEFLEDFEWRCGEPRSFFACIADTCFLVKDPVSGKQELLYANASGEPDESKVHEDLISILNRIFEWYCQGLKVEEIDSPNGGVFIAINESFYKVKSIITYIIDYHWKSIAMIWNSQNIDNLPVFSGVVTVSIWDAFLQFLASEEYSPGLFEMQVLADYLSINICVFKISGFNSLEVKLDVVDGKKVPFVFTPLVTQSCVLVVAETIDGFFQIMSPKSKGLGAVVRTTFSQPFFITRNVQERFKAITCMRETRRINDYIECSMVLRGPPSFYPALALFMQENRGTIPRFNSFRHVEEISKNTLIKIVDVYIFVVTEIFSKFFLLHGDGSDALGIHEFLKELADTTKEELQSEEVSKRNVIEWVKRKNIGVFHMFSTKFYGNGHVLQQMSDELGKIEKNSTFQANYHSILAEDDFGELAGTEGRVRYLSNYTGVVKTLEQLKQEMQKWLSRGVSNEVKQSILYHHYGIRIREERENIKKSRGKLDKRSVKDDMDKYEKELWDNHCRSEFLRKIPSEFEFEQIAMILKVRLMVFSDAWTRNVKKLLKFKGAVERLYDTGTNTPHPLVFLIGKNDTFSIMMFNKGIALRNDKEISRIAYEKALLECRTKWRRDVAALSDGTFSNVPKDQNLYKLVGVNPNASSKDILSIMTTGRVRKPLSFLHPDKLFSFLNGDRVFTPVLGEFGPQSIQEVNLILDYFEKALGFMRTKTPEMLDLAWQTITDDNARYLYHVKLMFIPLSLRRAFKIEELHNNGRPNPLGERFDKWSFGHENLGEASLVNNNSYYQNFMNRIPIFIQLKGRYPDYQKFGMKSSKEKQWDYGGVLSNVVRDDAVDRFEKRFNVSQRWGSDDLPSDMYAVMLPVQKSFSSVHCRNNEFKTYITRDTDSDTRNLIMTKIHIFSIVLNGEIPDMKTQKPSAESNFEEKAKWSNDWCGLKMCLQTAFFLGRHNSLFKKFLMEHIGNKEDIFRFEWLDTFLTPFQDDSWSLYKGRNTDEESLNFTGITNPYNVNYSTLRDAIHILFKTTEALGARPGEHNQKITDLISRGEHFLRTEGNWDSDENISAFFDKMDINYTYSDNRKSSEKKREKSVLLMRFLGLAFNVEFIILKSFIENDINSLTFDDDYFHYYTVRENGRDVKVTDLTQCFINRRGLYWCTDPTLSKHVYGQKLLGKDGVESSPVKACPLPIFVIWENDKWNILRWKSYHDVGVLQEQMLKKYKERKELREKVQQQKVLIHGADWKGRILPVGGAGGDNSSGNGGLGHFGADECDEGSSDSGESSDWGDSDDGDSDWSDSDDDHGGGDSDGDMRDRNRRDAFDSFMHGKRKHEPKALWGGGMPRQAPSRRSENDGAWGRPGGSVPSSGPRDRGWENTRSEFSLSSRRPSRRARTNLNNVSISSKSSRHVSFNEDQKEIHFMTQKVPMAVNVLKYLAPYGCCDLKLQSGQMEQTKILAVIFACCFDKAIIVPIKGCYTTRMMVACKGLRKDIVALARVRQMLKGCFDLKESSFHGALSELYKKRVVPAERIDELMQQVQSASDELWADDFRCSLVLARSYIQATLEGKVSPAPEYLSPELADLMNRKVFSRVTPEQRRMNQEMIRTLMKSNIGDQLLPLFRVVFHPDLHTWRLTLPKNYKKVMHPIDKTDGGPKYWQWDTPAAAATEFKVNGRERNKTIQY